MLALKVTACEALAVPTGWPPKVKFAGENFAAGAVPVPLNAMVSGLPAPV